MQSFPSHSVIDPAAIAEIRQIAGNEPALVSEIIDCYLQETVGLIAAMQEALVQQDTEGFTRNAHSLKSSSQCLGAMHLAKLCLELEQIGRLNRMMEQSEEVAIAMAQIQDEYDRVEAALNAERDR